jgi:hypothetical protein
MGLLATPQEQALMREVLERLATLPDAIRQTLTDHLWASIPVTVVENAYQAAMAPGDLDVTAQTGGYEKITSIITAVATGATGLVTLGSVKIPVPAGTTYLGPISIVLATQDVRRLTTAGGTGDTALVLCGEQLPTYGVMAP